MPIAPSPAVLRACDVLDHLAHHPTESFSVSELAREVRVPRATCDAILQALAVRRLVNRRDGDLRYELGPGSIAIGDAARIANPVLRAAKIEAERLARAIGTCIAVCVRDGSTARVAEVFDFGPVFALRARAGQVIPLVPPFGAAFVAWNDEEVEAWLARAEATLERSERERYRRVIAAIRRRGYSVSLVTPRRPALEEVVDTLASAPKSEAARRSRDELIREMMHSGYLADDLDAEAAVRVVQISAPVFDRTGLVAASLLVSGPNREVTGTELHALGSRLVGAATRATRSGGGLEPVAPRDDPEAAASSPRFGRGAGSQVKLPAGRGSRARRRRTRGGA